MRLAQSHNRTYHEPFWHVQLAILLTIGLQTLLHKDLVFSSKYIIAGLELVLLLLVSFPVFGRAVKRAFAIALIGIIGLANISSLGLVVGQLISKSTIDGKQLLLSSVAIYLTNIILFGILYWELDGSKANEPDFQFPQFSDPDTKGWNPTFMDYLYIAVTNATAFSPTDAMPLTHRTKILMTIHALVSLITVALVTARAVNILS